MYLSIVIPAYNEEQRLPRNLREIAEFVKKQTLPVEVLVVDDGSTDGTVSMVERDFPWVRVVRMLKNQGKGEALRQGFLAATGEYVLFTDADGSTHINEFEKMKPFLGVNEVLIGSRRAPGAEIRISQSWLKSSLGRFANFYIRHALDIPFHDTQCGFKLFAKKTMPVFTKLKTQGFGVDFELLARAKQEGFTIREIPVIWNDFKESRVSSADYFKSLVDVMRVRKNIRREYAK